MIGQLIAIVSARWKVAGQNLAAQTDGGGEASRTAIPAMIRSAPARVQAMIEAVENHMPQVIVIDEIGTELEAQAARTIAEWDALRNEIGDAVGGEGPDRWITVVFTGDPEWAE